MYSVKTIIRSFYCKKNNENIQYKMSKTIKRKSKATKASNVFNTSRIYDHLYTSIETN